MKFSAIAAALALAASANAHCIMGQVSIGGSNQGVGKAIRYPSSNNPVEDVSSGNMACGAGSSAKGDVISAAPGARVGIWFQHLLGGPQGSNDPDNPIASSHKGPIQIYIAKVSSATSSDGASASWTKIASEGLSGGRWAVDTMIAAGGWWYFNLPSCLAPGDYLVRTELLALHSAYNYPGAQFYISCIQLRVTGSGSWTPSGSLKFPGSYSGSDGGIKLNIYGSGGVPNNNNQPYTPPGGSVTQPTCNGNNNPTTTAAGTTLRTTTTSAGGVRTTTTANNNSGSGAPLWGQCGGIGWTGPTTCSSGRCVVNGPYYSQCIP